MLPPPRAVAKKVITATFAATFVVALVAARLVGRAPSFDIAFDDEVGYLSDGISATWPAADFGPAYSALYWLESRFLDDRVTLYFANWCVLLAGLLALTWWVSQRLRATPVVSVLATAFVGALGIVEVWPHVSLFAACLTGLSIGLALGRGPLHERLARAAIPLALGAFVRADLAVVFLAVVAAAILSAVLGRATRLRDARILLLAVSVFAVLTLTFGFPLGGEKSFAAFAAHFAFNLSQTGVPGDPWYQSAQMSSRAFGAADTIAEAAFANPGAFLWHLKVNLGRLPDFVELFDLSILPFPRSPAVSRCVAAAVLLGVLLFIPAAWRTIRDRTRAEERTDVVALAIVATCITGVVCASCLIIYPRPHYAVLAAPAVLAMSFLGWLGVVSRWRTRVIPERFSLATALLVAALVIAFYPSPEEGRPWYTTRPPAGAEAPPGVATVRLMRAIFPSGTTPMSILEGQFGYGILAGWDATTVEWPECTPFVSCLGSKRLNAVIVSPRLAELYGEDPGYASFVGNPERFGFKRWVVRTYPYELDGTYQVLLRAD